MRVHPHSACQIPEANRSAEERLYMEAPRIAVFSTPLVSTWVFDETHRILFDAGDGVTAMLDSRIHRIKLVALTHTHRDHCAGLMQLLNLRGGAGDFTTVFPEDSGSARALTGFLAGFDTRSTARVHFQPVAPGSMTPVEPERHFLRGFPTRHYPELDPPRVLSLGYQIVRQVDKVKQEFRGLPQCELDAIRLREGRERILTTIEDILLTVTGDTTPLPPETYRGSRVLLHECTFLDRNEQLELEQRGHPHSALDDVLDLALAAGVGHLGLYHVSRRYDDQRILAMVRQECARRAIPFPVSVALPGRVYDDLLAQRVWQGTHEGSSNVEE